MDTESLNYCIRELRNIADKFYFSYQEYINGKNEQERKNAYKEIKLQKDILRNIFITYPYLEEMINPYDEFFDNRYLYEGLNDLINKLTKSLEE